MNDEDAGRGGYGRLLVGSADTADFILQTGSVQGQFASLRELVSLAAQNEGQDPADARTAAERAQRVGPVPDELRDGLVRAVERVEVEQANAVLGLALDEAGQERFLVDPLAAMLELFDPARSADAATRELSGLVEAAEDPDGAALFLQSMLHRLAPAPTRSPVYPAILAALCAAVESVVAKALRRLVFNAGGYSSILDPGLDDAVHALIGSGGRLEQWAEKFAAYGVALEGSMIEWDELAEVFARRNLFLHRGGRVDARYRGRVPGAPPLGSVLELTAPYLEEAVTRCEALAAAVPLSLLALRGSVQAAQAAAFAAALARIAGAHGESLRSEAFAYLAVRLEPDPVEREAHRVNAWLARIERLGASSVAAEVEAWAAAGLAPVFALARHVLLGEDEAGLELLAALRADGTVSERDVRVWPLFQRWRGQGRI